jgi:hypothetical protein
MAFEVVDGLCDRETFDRCFLEAWDYISIERQRLGPDNLRESLWSSLNSHRPFMYVLDGHIVGVGSYDHYEYGGKAYAWYRYPTLGATQNGSKAWFYSAEFAKAKADYWSGKGLAGMIVIVNPTSPAAIALRSIWGTYGWWTPIQELPPETVFPQFAVNGVMANNTVMVTDILAA